MFTRRSPPIHGEDRPMTIWCPDGHKVGALSSGEALDPQGEARSMTCPTCGQGFKVRVRRV